MRSNLLITKSNLKEQKLKNGFVNGYPDKTGLHQYPADDLYPESLVLSCFTILHSYFAITAGGDCHDRRMR